MKNIHLTVCRVVTLVALAFSAMGTAPGLAGTLKCPPDSVPVGTVCVDKYEESVWQIAPSNRKLVKKVQEGKATLTDLRSGGAVQLGCTGTPYPDNFPENGQWTPVSGSSPPSPGVYAASVPGVVPSGCTTWFRAAQACLLSGKRLLTNREWQDAAAGTPDPGAADDGTTTCATNTMFPGNTGVRSGCVSSWGAFDMVGNVNEWVADWVPQRTACPGWDGFSDDVMCFAGADTTFAGSGVLIRGGSSQEGTLAGVFAVEAVSVTTNTSITATIGFRCGR